MNFMLENYKGNPDCVGMTANIHNGQELIYELIFSDQNIHEAVDLVWYALQKGFKLTISPIFKQKEAEPKSETALLRN